MSQYSLAQRPFWPALLFLPFIVLSLPVAVSQNSQPTAFQQSQDGQGLLSIQTEHFATNASQGDNDWVMVTPGGQSGSAAMQALPNTGDLINSNYAGRSPRLDFVAEFSETGTHYVWVRGLGDTDSIGKNDSVHVGLDGVEVSTADRIADFDSSYSWSNTTMDSGTRATIEVTSPGVHMINVWMREDGLVVDKLVLTTNANLDVPAVYGQDGPPESPQGQEVLPAPVIAPDGGTFTSPVNVTISAEPGSTIYYTTDGTAPDMSSNLYGGAFTVSTDTTVRAFAVQSGLTDSPEASADFVIEQSLQAPSINPAGGSYTGSVDVAITAQSGASIHYTTNGATPTSASPLYTGSFTLTADATVRAIAVQSGFSDSAVASESYTITSGGGGSGGFQQSQDGQGLLSMQAEHFTTNASQGDNDWVMVTPGGQSGAAAMQALPNTGDLINSNYADRTPRLDFVAEFTETGTHYVWLRGLGDSDGDGDNDSLHVGLDGVEVSTADRITEFNANYSWSNTTMDSGSRATIEVTSPGVHTINVWMREDGLVFDKLVLTTDANLDVPAVYGQDGPPESPQGQEVLPAPMIAPDGGTFTSPVNVTISAEPGSTIYYTTDGTAPDMSSNLYGGAFTVSSDTTVRAFAVQSGWTDSPEASADFVIEQSLQAPSINPASGSYAGSVDVVISAPSGASIHYTTDGSTPTSASPLYTGSFTLTADATVQAIAVQSGFSDSPVSSASYTITSGGGGGSGSAFQQSQDGQGLLSMQAEHFTTNTSQGDNDWVMVAPGGQLGAAAMQALPNTGDLINSNYADRTPRLDFVAEFTETGTHYVWLRGLGDSDGDGDNDSLHVGLNGVEVSTADRISSFDSGYSWSNTTMDSGSRATIEVTSPGVHTINVWMREDGLVVDKLVLTTDATLDVPAVYGDSGPADSPRGQEVLPAPVMAPDGGTFTSPVNVTISAEPGSTIYYTTDGTAPDMSSNLYGGAFTVSSDTTVRAIAVQSGWTDSPEASADFVIEQSLQAPSINPAGGSYTGSVDVTITAQSGASIHYTTNGATPTSASPLYTGSFTLTADATVRAIAVQSGFSDSTVSSESYTITSGGGGGGSGSAFQQSQDGQGLLSMQAEHFTTNTSQGDNDWVMVTPGGQSGAAAMQALPNTGDLVNSNYADRTPRLDFVAEFTETGTHYVWLRGLGDSDGDGDNDSLHVGLDGVELSTADRITEFNANYSWSNTTMDSARATIEVTSPGVHTINVWMREDGLVFDKLVLTTDANLDVPAVYGDSGPAESPRDASMLPAPVFSPAGGNFTGPVDVTISAQAGSTIYYTTDGTPPDTSSSEYDGSFTVSSSTTVRAFAVQPDWIDSNEASATYTITSGETRIVVDPQRAGWLYYSDGRPHFTAGPGDPEDFLYRGSRNSDGTRSGDQMQLIDKLNGTGANSIYMQAIRSHGGDGGPTHNPFVDNDPSKGVSDAVLDQWESWFSAMDQAGIVIYLFLYDDGSLVWNTGNSVGSEEREFIRTLVNRFERYNHLVWVVAEEYGEAYSAARMSAIAAEIAAADDYNHPIGVHKNSGTSFTEFEDDPHIDQFTMQINDTSRTELHDKVSGAWANSGGRYNLNMSESVSWGNGETARKKSWAIAMGGAYVMAYEMTIDTTPLSDIEDLGRLRLFFESTNFDELAPRDDLAAGNTEYVLAKPGSDYILYASNATSNLGVRNLDAGVYDLTWLDAADGDTVTEQRSASGGDELWNKPSSIGVEAVVYVEKVSDLSGSTTFPGATWQSRQPSEVNMDAAVIDQIVSRVGGSGCIVRGGYMVRCWGSTTSNFDWASAAKPVMSTLLLMAVDEGRLASVDDRISDWGWSLNSTDSGITFSHLANMVSGYSRGEGPGEAWAYNDIAIELYGLTLERVFGTDLDTAAQSRMSALQFQDGDIFGSRGGLGVRASVRDFARIGWLWANEGQWNGAQIVPQQAFRDAAKPHVASSVPLSTSKGSDYLGVGTFGGTTNQIDHGPGIYGFNWWFNGLAPEGRHWPDAPLDTYQANGHWGSEVVIVIPSLSLVVAAAGDWGTYSSSTPGDSSGQMNVNLKLLSDAVTGPMP